LELGFQALISQPNGSVNKTDNARGKARTVFAIQPVTQDMDNTRIVFGKAVTL
jgi:hypothetical protein